MGDCSLLGGSQIWEELAVSIFVPENGSGRCIQNYNHLGECGVIQKAVLIISHPFQISLPSIFHVAVSTSQVEI
jgi:hypothetical protein